MQEAVISPMGDDEGRIDGGVPLDVYAPLAPALTADPRFSTIGGVDLLARLTKDAQNYIQDCLSAEIDLNDQIHDLPFKYWLTRTPSEYWKARHSATYGFCSEQFKHIARDPRCALIDKIVSSHWRNGLYNPSWEEIEDCYAAISSFDLGLDGFEVRLDHTTAYKPSGYAFHELIHLDGALAYHVLHKGERVMTIGFSLVKGRRVLIQQVQLASKRGNRWLYRFPKNRLEFILERFCAAFPRHTIHLIDPEDLCNSIAAIYQGNIERIEKAILDPDNNPESSAGRELQDRIDAQRAKLAWFNEDRGRLEAFYKNTGRFEPVDVVTFRDNRHYRMAA